MAVEQGICKNCGSLVVFNTQDEMCDCIFCNAVFPRAELIPIDAELKDIVFPNEKFEKQTETKGRNQYSVMADLVTPAVRHEKTKPVNADNEAERQFEISAKDVKAPKKTLAVVIGVSAAIVAVVAAISIPLYFSRTKLLKEMQSKMPSVVEGVVSVDTSKDDDGRTTGYGIQGLNSQIVYLATEDEVDEAKAKQLFDNYCKARSEAKSGLSDDTVKMTIYSEGGIYTVNMTEVTFSEDTKAAASK